MGEKRGTVRGAPLARVASYERLAGGAWYSPLFSRFDALVTVKAVDLKTEVRATGFG